MITIRHQSSFKDIADFSYSNWKAPFSSNTRRAHLRTLFFNALLGCSVLISLKTILFKEGITNFDIIILFSITILITAWYYYNKNI
jgi:predicted membrane channel-forming protein YqfA (hemolysin III family)